MSWRHLTLEERYQIQVMLRAHASRAEIARALDRSPSTITRELQRNSDRTCVNPYVAQRAQKLMLGRRAAKGAASRKIRGELLELVEQRLRLSWSPQQIAGRLKSERGVTLSHETIYQHILRDNALPLGESKRLRYCLRWHGYKHHRFKKSRMAEQTRARKNWIGTRPRRANNRAELGHWERDLLLGKRGDSAVLTIVDRKSRYLLLKHVPRVDSDHVAKATLAALASQRRITKTVTNDNGIEFQRDQQLQQKLGVPIFFTEPASPWQRGSVENANGLIRQYLPKGADFDSLPPWATRAVELTLNLRPRRTLGYRTPHEVHYAQELELMAQSRLHFGLEISYIS